MSEVPEATPTNQEAAVTSNNDAPSSDVTSPNQPEVAADVTAAKPEAEVAAGDVSKSSTPAAEETEKKEETKEEVAPAGEAVVAGTAPAPASAEGEGEPIKEPGSPKPEVESPVPMPSAGEELETARVVIVTGASSGIGYHVARVLCARKHDVILACRNEQKAQRALDKIRKETPEAKATFMLLDLSDLDSVRTFVNNFHATGKQLSTLVNNAGMILNAKDTKLQFTKENFELTLATNHLGHFLLTNLLLNDLKKAASELGDARVVIVTSALHDSEVARKKGGAAVLAYDIEDPFLYKEGAFNGLQAYKNSKLANVMFTYELARQVSNSGVKVNAIDPGFVPTTELLRNSNSVQKFYARYVLHGLLRFTKQTRSGGQAGTDVASLAVTDKYKEMTGKYIHNGQEAKSSDESLDESLQKKLWELSARYVHLEGFEPLNVERPVVKMPPTPAAEATVNGLVEKDATIAVEAEAASQSENKDSAADKSKIDAGAGDVPKETKKKKVPTATLR